MPGVVWPIVSPETLNDCVGAACEHIFCFCDEAGNVIAGLDYTESSDVDCLSQTYSWYHRNADGLVDAVVQSYTSPDCPAYDYLQVDWYATPFSWGTSWEERAESTRDSQNSTQGAGCFCAADARCVECADAEVPVEADGSGVHRKSMNAVKSRRSAP